MIEFSRYIQCENMLSGSGLGMILFDEKYHVVNVCYARQDGEFRDNWKHILGKCTVPPRVCYLRFMQYGRRKGQVCFDGVGFSRISLGRGL